MAKFKTPTPQEIYKARKEREDTEKDALLPPGLINHGNTCFMNSVLQGLISTHLLSDLVLFVPPNQSPPSGCLASHSPLLTNGHGFGGAYEKEHENDMPIGDVFVNILSHAWAIQAKRSRESMSPRVLLTSLGKKYDQYLDFAQQDAHEFLRQLLDAMRMEEFDVIKRRQPPLTKGGKRRRKSMAPSSPSIPEQDQLVSFVDMLFGGKLTSILVCEKCKHISQTQEDFNDLSLSIKPDELRGRKRDRLRNLLSKRPKNVPVSAHLSTEFQRSTSVPPSPRGEAGGKDGFFAEVNNSPVRHGRRRSLDIGLDLDLPTEDGAAIATPVPITLSLSLSQSAESATSTTNVSPARISHIPLPPVLDVALITPMTAVTPVTPPLEEGKHVEFATEHKPDRKDKKRDEDGWAKLGRRLTMGLRERKVRSHSREQNPVEKENTSYDDNPQSTLAAKSVVPSQPLPSPTDAPFRRGRASRPQSPSPLTPTTSVSRTSSAKPITLQPTRSPQPSKPTAAESAYLRDILVDIIPSSASNPFVIFRTPSYSGSSPQNPAAQSLWLKLSQIPSIEESLRMFTAVEVLDGENQVGCRRCWKIAQGLFQPRQFDPCSGDESDSDEGPQESVVTLMTPGGDLSTPNLTTPPNLIATPFPRPSASVPSSMSTPNLSQVIGDINALPGGKTYSPSLTTTDESGSPVTSPETERTAFITPLPALDTYAGHPIPSISTTAPDSPVSASLNTEGPDPLLLSDSLKTPKASFKRPREHDGLVVTDNDTSDPESDASIGMSAHTTSAASSEKTKLSTSSRSAIRAKQVVMRPAYKRYLVGTPPPVLVIHLKRFQQINKTLLTSFSHGFKKLDDFVSFSEYLDLGPFLAPKKEDFGLGKTKNSTKNIELKKKCMYRLYAVVVHIGNMLGGHYVAYVALPSAPPHPPPKSDAASETTLTPTDPPTSHSRTSSTRSSSSTAPPVPPIKPVTRQWAYISDTVVRLTTLEEVLKVNAYICMYERI